MFKSLQLLLDILPFIWIKNAHIRFQIILTIFLVLITACINLYIPIALKAVIDRSTQFDESISNAIYWSALTYGMLWISAHIFAQLRCIAFYKVVSHNLRLLLLKLFQHLINLSLTFHINKKSGEILSALDKAQDSFPKLLDGMLMQVFPVIFEISVAFSIVYNLYGLKYGITLIATVFIYLISVIITSKGITFSQEKNNEKHFQFSSFLLDILQNYEAVKYFNNDHFEYKNCDNFLKQKENALAHLLARRHYTSMCQMSIVGLGITIITLQASHGIKMGNLTMGDFILLNGYILQFSLPMGFFGYILQDLRQSFTDLQYVINILKKKSTLITKVRSNSIPFKLGPQGIEFENVSFYHENNPIIIKNLSFNIPRGKTIALVGKTGSGKSTIVKLLCHFFDVSSGRILINGRDIRDLHLQDLRSLFGIVPQDITLFNRTLYDNIAYGNLEASRAEVEKAIRLAHLETFIETLPEGYNTIIGERGVKLSGGEKQRVAIARAILKKPEIYILDEATASLDSRTEQIIHKNLTEISTEATMFIITHRLLTVLHADKILVLENGQIMEYGTHESLLKNNGIYTEMWNKQSKQRNEVVPLIF